LPQLNVGLFSRRKTKKAIQLSGITMEGEESKLAEKNFTHSLSASEDGFGKRVDYNLW